MSEQLRTWCLNIDDHIFVIQWRADIIWLKTQAQIKLQQLYASNQNMERRDIIAFKYTHPIHKKTIYIVEDDCIPPALQFIDSANDNWVELEVHFATHTQHDLHDQYILYSDDATADSL